MMHIKLWRNEEIKGEKVACVSVNKRKVERQKSQERE